MNSISRVGFPVKNVFVMQGIICIAEYNVLYICIRVATLQKENLFVCIERRPYWTIFLWRFFVV